MFQQLIEHAPDGVVILEAGRIVFINETAARLLGTTREAALGTPISGYLPPADAEATAERIGRMLATGEPMTPNEYGTLADPTRTVEIKSIPWHWEGRRAVLAFARDVSERKVLQQQLIHAGRLAAVGTLAAGIAHEINNPLQYMQMSLHVLASELASEPEAAMRVAEAVRDLDHGIERIASITRGLRAFARPKLHAAPSPVDPVAVVDQALKMVDNDLRHRAKLVREVAEVSWVIANASELEQVLVNLLLNAIQALTGHAEETIAVSVEARGDDHVAIVVRDTGRGMTAAVCERVFDPFFTTKPVGTGMGLGLSISKGLVDAFGGSLELASMPGAGTTATVLLRAHHSKRWPDATPPRAVVYPRRRVLVVDDEPRVRELLAELLADVHEVDVAAGGDQAIAAAREREFDAIVCDIMMAGTSGVDVYRAIQRELPGLEKRIVFITGGAFVPELAEFVSATGNRVLEKPVDAARVLAAIEAVAAAPRA
ncbi:MAG: ATP-binding protein [Acidobacteriota bacterium]